MTEKENAFDKHADRIQELEKEIVQKCRKCRIKSLRKLLIYWMRIYNELDVDTLDTESKKPKVKTKALLDQYLAHGVKGLKIRSTRDYKYALEALMIIEPYHNEMLKLHTSMLLEIGHGMTEKEKA
ncbi:MAG: hypothetical protein ABSB89_08540 [Candidatus Bathyarchaeia archaeon]|jgi:hypothetical protein